MKDIKRLTPKDVIKRVKKLKSARSTWESHWQEVMDYFLLRKNTITSKKSEGQKRTWHLLDNTGVYSAEILAGALHGMLTNPTLPWFELETGVPDIDSLVEVKAWLQRQARKMLAVFNNSNFHTEIYELYIDLITVGTACFKTEEDKKNVVKFSTKFITDYYIEENSFGVVDKIYFKGQWKSEDLISEFGKENLPEKVLKAFEKGIDEKFCLIHAIYPKKLVDAENKDSMQYVSQFILEECDHEIEVGEFNEFPCVVPRWSKASGETYGRSPAMMALPEQKVLNKMSEVMLSSSQLAAQPPFAMEDDGLLSSLNFTPLGITYYRSGSEKPFPLYTGSNIDFGYQAVEDRRKRVRDSFYIDQLRLQQGGPMMTATEVLQRTEEAARLLGPVLSRMTAEFLQGIIDRTFRIMWEKKLIEPPPEVLGGQKLRVKYSSLIAKSQKAIEGQSVMQLISAIGPFLQLDQSAADVINSEGAIKALANIFGTPFEVLKTTEEVEGIRAQRAQAQQNAEAQMQQQREVDNSLTIAKAMETSQGIING